VVAINDLYCHSIWKDEFQSSSGEEKTIFSTDEETFNEQARSDDDCAGVQGIVRGRVTVRGSINTKSRWLNSSQDPSSSTLASIGFIQVPIGKKAVSNLQAASKTNWARLSSLV
jgi:hypothetical protein